MAPAMTISESSHTHIPCHDFFTIPFHWISIYEYNVKRGEEGPSRSWTTASFSCSSFYVKSALSTCDRYLLTGSSTHHAFLWDLHSSSVLCMKGHTNEVTSVAWSRSRPDMVGTPPLQKSLFTHLSVIRWLLAPMMLPSGYGVWI